MPSLLPARGRWWRGPDWRASWFHRRLELGGPAWVKHETSWNNSLKIFQVCGPDDLRWLECGWDFFFRSGASLCWSFTHPVIYCIPFHPFHCFPLFSIIFPWFSHLFPILSMPIHSFSILFHPPFSSIFTKFRWFAGSAPGPVAGRARKWMKMMGCRLIFWLFQRHRLHMVAQ